MKENLLFVGFCFFMVSALIIPTSYAFPNEMMHSHVQEQPNIYYSITTNINNLKSIFQIIVVNVTMKNLGNESVSLDIGGYPGGRFYIYNDEGKLINMFPKYFLTLLWGITLEPGKEYTLYRGLWVQRNIFGRLVRNGEYHIYGATGIIYFDDEYITPDPFGPVNVTIARRFFP